MKVDVWGLAFIAALVVGVVYISQSGARAHAAAAAPADGGALCKRDITSFVAFKDPASVRVNSVVPNPQRPGRFEMSVSAKNSFGGYGDPITCACGAPNGAVTDIHCDGAL